MLWFEVNSDEDDADLVTRHHLDPPVVKVVLQATITRLEHQLISNKAVLEHLGHVEDVIFVVLG